ncbi:MAG: colanic acid biosynthesis glycosyltransferase WcaL, partial [Pseudobdellovibrionaceae bacterium]
MIDPNTREIAYVLKGYPRLSETFIAQEIYMLEQRGYRITILSMRQAREKEKQPIVDMIKARVVYIPEYIWESFFTVFNENKKIFLRKPFLYSKLFTGACLKSLWIRDVDPMKRFLQAGWVVGREKIGTVKSPIHHFHSHFIHAPTEMTTYMAKLSALTYSISAHAKDIYTIPQNEV